MILPLVVLGVLQREDYTKGPVFTLAKRLVGAWEGRVGKEATVRFHFTLEQDGKLIVANGSVIAKGLKKPIPMRSSLGWDPAMKQVYYLDQHDANIVYFGHVTESNGSLVFDFRGLCGDLGHYRSTVKITRNHYESTMDSEKNGKWTPSGLHIVMNHTS